MCQELIKDKPGQVLKLWLCVYNQSLAGGVMRLLFVITILCSMLTLHQVYAAEQIITGEDTALFDQSLSLPCLPAVLHPTQVHTYFLPPANPLTLPGYLISHVPPVRAPPLILPV